MINDNEFRPRSFVHAATRRVLVRSYKTVRSGSDSLDDVGDAGMTIISLGT